MGHALDTSGTKLVTRNLIVSAHQAMTADKASRPQVEDLCTLIDLVCLSDSLVVLGPPGKASRGPKGQILSLLEAEEMLHQAGPADGEATQLAATAQKHLLAYLGRTRVHDLGRALGDALRPSEVIYALTNRPDGEQDVAAGVAALKKAPTRAELEKQLMREAGVARATTFVMRTFLYLAYSDLKGMAFVPDSVRVGITAAIARSEQRLRATILPRLTSADQRLFYALAAPKLERISPLAAVVFERASSRGDVLQKLGELRAELDGLRKRLREIEYDLAFGSGKKVAKAESRWSAAIAELERSFGREPSLVSLDKMLSFSTDVAEIADKPYDAKSWVAGLLGLPVSLLRRTIARRPLVELHRLRWARPGAKRRLARVTQLFGCTFP